MIEYLIIQSEGETLYAGEGEMSEWKKKLGKMLDREVYKITNVGISQNRVSRTLMILSTRTSKEFNYSPGHSACLEFQLDSKVRDLLKRIIRGEAE